MNQALEIASVNARLLKNEIPHWKALELIFEIRARYEKLTNQ